MTKHKAEQIAKRLAKIEAENSKYLDYLQSKNPQTEQELIDRVAEQNRGIQVILDSIQHKID
jgi:ribosomal protein S15P/S13E